MKQILFVLIAALAGLIGGFFGARIVPPGKQQGAASVIRAHRFELVDESGQPISFWGIDQGKNAVLAFGSQRPAKSQTGSDRGSDHHHALDSLNNQRATIGVIDDDPFLHFRASDGKTRVRMYLSDYGKPILLMEDDRGPRVSLGVEQSDTPSAKDNDWTLDFGPDNRARIGVYNEKVGDQTYVRGIFSVKPERVKYR